MFHHLFLCPYAGTSFSSNVKQKYKSKHWFISQGTPKITLSKESFSKKNDHIFIQLGKVHKIQNLNKKSLKIIEAQVGSLLKETDIARYHYIYGRIK
jgi:mannose-6-phosphate isomerase-like protein (cupin superfamily)